MVVARESAARPQRNTLWALGMSVPEGVFLGAHETHILRNDATGQIRDQQLFFGRERVLHGMCAAVGFERNEKVAECFFRVDAEAGDCQQRSQHAQDQPCAACLRSAGGRSAG